MNYIENRIFDEIKLGDTACLKHILTKKELTLYALMSGDNNTELEKNHNTSIFKTIPQGMWEASLLSTLLNTQLPGPGTIYLEQNLLYHQPAAMGDEITLFVTVLQKDCKRHHILFECHGINQNNQMLISGTINVLAPTTKIKREQGQQAKIEITQNKKPWYEGLIRTKKSLKPLKTGIVHPVDALSLHGAIAAAEERLIIPVLIGPKQKIKDAAQAAHINIDAYEIITTKHSQEAAELAVNMVHNLQIEAIMKGKLHTDELMRPIIDKEKGLRTGRRMSHIFALDVPNYPKPIFLTDAAINLFPNLKEKCDIVQNAIDLFQALELGVPKVAILSAIETVNEKIPSTLDATALCKMAERGQITGGILDGPLAFDNAISIDSAREKGIVSPVAGDADILIMPDLESGNMLYKQMTYLSGIEAAGMVLGARVPIILTSRGSNELSRKESCALALLYARRTTAARAKV